MNSIICELNLLKFHLNLQQTKSINSKFMWYLMPMNGIFIVLTFELICTRTALVNRLQAHCSYSNEGDIEMTLNFRHIIHVENLKFPLHILTTYKNESYKGTHKCFSLCLVSCLFKSSCHVNHKIQVVSYLRHHKLAKVVCRFYQTMMDSIC